MINEGWDVVFYLGSEHVRRDSMVALPGDFICMKSSGAMYVHVFHLQLGRSTDARKHRPSAQQTAM